MNSYEKPELPLAEKFNTEHQEYASFIETDPIRNYLHYPTVINELGEIKGQRILDIGCGDGLFDRKLVKEFGTHIVGYDISPNLIQKAKLAESTEPLQIEYIEADPLTFHSREKFDNAVSVMVLPYSPDENYIKDFFTSAFQNLKEKGKFISIVFNPEFNKFDEVIANRFFRKSDKEKVNFDFLDPDNQDIKFSATLSQFSKAGYENAAREGGFKNIEWRKLNPTPEGVSKLGSDFWKKAIEEQPYAFIITQK